MDHKLSAEAVNAIKLLTIRRRELNSSDVHAILGKSKQLFENEKMIFNLDDPRGLSDDEYCLSTSLSKDDSNELIEITSSPNIRNSSNRLIWTAVGVYLCKLHLGLSSRILACMFQLPDRRTVFKTINSVHQSIFDKICAI